MSFMMSAYQNHFGLEEMNQLVGISLSIRCGLKDNLVRLFSLSLPLLCIEHFFLFCSCDDSGKCVQKHS